VGSLELSDKLKNLQDSYPEQDHISEEHIGKLFVVAMSELPHYYFVSNVVPNQRKTRTRKKNTINYLRDAIWNYHAGQNYDLLDLDQKVLEKATHRIIDIHGHKENKFSLESVMGKFLSPDYNYELLGKAVMEGAQQHKLSLKTDTGLGKNIIKEYNAILEALTKYLD